MFKLLRNYIREQKNNLLQMFGLGFLVMIMIIAFLALKFSNNYLFEQYVKDIAHNEFNQYTFFSPMEYVNFYGKYNEKDKAGFYLNNINYYQKDNTIDKEKMAKATFQLTIPDATRPDIYRFNFMVVLLILKNILLLVIAFLMILAIIILILKLIFLLIIHLMILIKQR